MNYYLVVLEDYRHGKILYYDTYVVYDNFDDAYRWMEQYVSTKKGWEAKEFSFEFRDDEIDYLRKMYCKKVKKGY